MIDLLTFVKETSVIIAFGVIVISVHRSLLLNVSKTNICMIFYFKLFVFTALEFI